MASTDLFTQTQTIRRKRIILSSGKILHVTENDMGNAITWSDTDRNEQLVVSVEVDVNHNFIICGTFLKRDGDIDPRVVEEICSILLRKGTTLSICEGYAGTYEKGLEAVIGSVVAFQEVVFGDKSPYN